MPQLRRCPSPTPDLRGHRPHCCKGDKAMTVTMPEASTPLRCAELAELAQALREQRTRAIDVVVPAARLRAAGGAVELCGVTPVLTGEGVTTVDGFYRPTVIGEEGLAA